MTAALAAARAVADAVLYEGYLLYPYRASSSKNQVRWQFGVLGPAGAEPGIGEPSGLRAEFLLQPHDHTGALSIHLRFLQLQRRQCFDRAGVPVDALELGSSRLLSWDEAVPVELEFGPFELAQLMAGQRLAVEVPGGRETEPQSTSGPSTAAIGMGELVRTKLALRAELTVSAVTDGAVHRVLIRLENLTEAEPAGADRDSAIARSLLGTHLLARADDARFVSLLEPPDELAEAAGRCRNERCWPVLAGPGDDLLLVSPIILYDYPEVAAQSAGALFDSTEIDEILTLRVMTMTDAEKAEARATDPQAAAIIDRCDAMSAQDLQLLHGVLRDPHFDGTADPARPSSPSYPAAAPDFPTLHTPADGTDGPAADRPWWDPGMDAAVSPETDTVLVGEVAVGKGSLVRLRPTRRADAQDLFFAGQQAKVTAVFADVDGNSHVAVVLSDDPAADLHEWYGRYLYFAPDELEPLGEPARPGGTQPGPPAITEQRKEG